MGSVSNTYNPKDRCPVFNALAGAPSTGTPGPMEVNFGIDDLGCDFKVFGATSGTYMLWDESADSLVLAGAATIAQTGTYTVAAIASLISTTSSATSGQANSLVSTMTSTGNGKSGSVAANFYLVEGGNTEYVYPVYVGSAAVANKTITQMAGVYLYLGDMGTAVQHQAGISINRDVTNVGVASDCFLEMRNHGAAAATTWIKLVGAATYLIDLNQGDLALPFSNGSDSTNCSHKAAVRMADGSTRYLHLFTD